MSRLDACTLTDLPRQTDARGNLTFIEAGRHVPFPIRRIYYLYGVPAGAGRGGHAHKRLEQMMVALAGSFRVTLDDGSSRREVVLSRPDQGLYICPMVWRELADFSAGAVCLVMASEPYDESDYYRDHAAFLRAVEARA